MAVLPETPLSTMLGVIITPLLLNSYVYEVAVAPPDQLIVAVVSLGTTETTGAVGGGIKVVTVVLSEDVVLVELTAVTIRVYGVEAVNPVKVIELLVRLLSVEGVAVDPFSVYV